MREGQGCCAVPGDALDVDCCAIGQAGGEQMFGEKLGVHLEFLQRAGELRVPLAQLIFAEHRQGCFGDPVVIRLDCFAAA